MLKTNQKCTKGCCDISHSTWTMPVAWFLQVYEIIYVLVFHNCFKSLKTSYETLQAIALKLEAYLNLNSTINVTETMLKIRIISALADLISK